MRVRGALRSKYFIPYHAILAAIFVFGAPIETVAQIDPNLQSRLTTFSPPITVLRPEIAGVETTKRSAEADKTCQLIKIPLKKRPGLKTTFVLPRLSTIYKCGAPQPRMVKISFPFNPTYETNALKSNTSVHPDTSVGFGGSILVTGPGIEGRSYDVIGFSASSASARYSNFFAKSFDSLTEQGIYQIFLGAHHIDGTTIDFKKEEVANLLTVDTLSLGFLNQTAFMPGFHGETDLFTPQATLARQNIALGENLCATPPDPNKPGPMVKRLGFCYYTPFTSQPEKPWG
jgi:hypothetical protein